jgi:hypothetical protein
MKTEKEIRAEYEMLKEQEAFHREVAMNAKSSPIGHWIDIHNSNYALMLSYRDRKIELMWVLGIDPEEAGE